MVDAKLLSAESIPARRFFESHSIPVEGDMGDSLVHKRMYGIPGVRGRWFIVMGRYETSVADDTIDVDFRQSLSNYIGRS